MCSRLVIRDLSAAQDRTARLRLSGELHRDTVQGLCDQVVMVLSGGGRRSVVVDVSSVTWCDNASLFTLLGIHRALQSTGGGLRLVAGSRPTDRTPGTHGEAPAPDRRAARPRP
ncbi:hypothetical protein GCM10010145_60680 [Streptomyces ruber]|uniref:STAS domain-containing protein n=2 Tax=Streptomyces TaxID=1883 RepID=A0A918BNV8_9ACTN|nr:STAS domain-containing protein [Streptomyces ruber]GGQ82915.1 hypothetical protein GCM10010145_60680 [Streptomyces ruber]